MFATVISQNELQTEVSLSNDLPEQSSNSREQVILVGDRDQNGCSGWGFGTKIERSSVGPSCLRPRRGLALGLLDVIGTILRRSGRRLFIVVLDVLCIVDQEFVQPSCPCQICTQRL